MASSTPTGVICASEAYTKRELMLRLGISQRSWDKMLDKGLPYTPLGHTRWVTGRAVIEYLENESEQKGGSSSTS